MPRTLPTTEHPARRVAGPALPNQKKVKRLCRDEGSGLRAGVPGLPEDGPGVIRDLVAGQA
jgi:hypothetical protein